MLKNTILILGFCHFFIQCGWTQAIITLDAFLKSKIQQNTLENYPTNKAFKVSWIENIDFRTETNQFDFKLQHYTIRATPSSPKVRKALSRLYQSYQEKASLKDRSLSEGFIELAYEEALRLYETSRKLILKKNWLTILEDKEKVQQKLSHIDTKNLKDWLNIQEEIAQLKIEIFRHEAILKSLMPNDQKLDWSDIIEIERIFAFFEQRKESDEFLSEEKQIAIKQQILDREIALEMAEKKKIIDFFQIKYNGPSSDPFKEKVSLTAGFQFPFSGNRKLKLEELAIEKDGLQKETLVKKQLNSYKAITKAKQINSLSEELFFARNIMAAQYKQTELITNKNAQREGSNPLLLLLLYQKENHIKNELDFLDLELLIYKEYVGYLKLTELLFQVPFRNYLKH